MDPKQIVSGLELGASGRVLYDQVGTDTVRANEIILWPEQIKIIVVVVT